MIRQKTTPLEAGRGQAEVFHEIVPEQPHRHGVDQEKVDVAWVPGALELPLAARRLAERGRYDAIVCLGAVIRGETPHFDYVASQAAAGISRVALDTGVPTIFGVITANTLEQALERAGGKAGNKGYDAVITAIEMANLLEQVEGTGGC